MNIGTSSCLELIFRAYLSSWLFFDHLWQSWIQHLGTAQEILSPEKNSAREKLQWLTTFRFQGLVCWGNQFGVFLKDRSTASHIQFRPSGHFHRMFHSLLWKSEWLVGGLEHQFYFPISIGLLIIPIDELIFFRGVAQPPTRWKWLSSMISLQKSGWYCMAMGLHRWPASASTVMETLKSLIKWISE